MRVMLIFAVFMVFAAKPCAAFDKELAKGYAFAFAAAMQAKAECPGLVIDETMLAILRSKTGLTDEDDPWLKLQFDQMKVELRSAMRRIGSDRWCEDAISLLGPTGMRVIRP